MTEAPYSPDPDPPVSRRRYLRERMAREEAETLLEHKSRALFAANQSLQYQADLLEQKVAERTADLERARHQAEAASEAKSAFLAAMSHEIRTPLNGVLGMAAALEDTHLTAEQRRILRVVTGSGELLLNVINDILDLSKIESGQTELETVPFDLAGALRSAQSLYGLKAHEKGIGFVVDLDRSCDCVVRGDETRLRQILNNLVSNAIKFTDAGGVTLRARTRAVPNGSDVTQGEDPPEDRVLMTLEIEDTGIGLRCDQIPNLFKRFTQADASITRRFGGSGLGLAITSQLVDVMGGTIEVDSTYGQGSRFTVRLAFGVGGPAVPTDTDDAAMAALHDQVRARQPKLLVAEDNATNRMVLEHRLKRIGLTAEFVTDGAQALARYQPGAYDVVLMDVHMPVMDGVTATRAIRDREAAAGPTGPRVAIIAFSADAMREQVAQYLGVGMDAHLAKPGHRDDLVRVLAQVLT